MHEGSDQPEQREEYPAEEQPPVSVSERPEAEEEEQQQVQDQAADTRFPTTLDPPNHRVFRVSLNLDVPKRWHIALEG